MLDASATRRLYVDDEGRICCGKPGRSKGRTCGRPILINGLVADKSDHEYSLEELLEARVYASQDSVDAFLGRYYAIRRSLVDPLSDYRQIEGLIVIGPAELDKACRSPNPENPNPLGLKDGWIPNIEVPAAMDQWIRSEKWRTEKHWATRAALVLMPPEIAGIPTSLIGQQKIWGVPHDGLSSGAVRQDVFWTNLFVGPNYIWANIPAVPSWQWLLIYEHPIWTAKLSWEKQQQAASERKTLISTVAQDALALNLVLAATGIRLRVSTYSRTSTCFGGGPLGVRSLSSGVHVDQGWDPGSAGGGVAASVQGVPGNLDT